MSGAYIYYVLGTSSYTGKAVSEDLGHSHQDINKAVFIELQGVCKTGLELEGIE
jgi:hypothetical protein